MADDQEPAPPDGLHHVEFDVSTGELAYRSLTPMEVAAHRERLQEAEDERIREERDRAELAAQVAGHPDPLVRLLAQRAGLA
jgi:hypothetical protein